MQLRQLGATGMGLGCATLFGLPFAAGGLFMTWMLLSTLYDSYRVQNWVATPAEVLSTDLEVHHGDDSTSYEVVAEYEYTYDGQTYTSDRVGIATDMEADSYDRNKHAELKKHRQSGDPVTCYVNPDDPQQAVLDRALRPTVVIFPLPFVICFNLVGFGLIAGAWYGAAKERADAARLAKTPDEPWRVRRDWESGVVRSSTSASALGAVVLALFWNGLSMPAFALAMLNDAEWWVVLLVGLFPLIGLGLIAEAVRGVMQRVRFGVSTLRLAATPGVVGGELAGVVLAPESVRPEEGFRAKLTCLRTIVTRDSDGDKSHSQQTEWEDERVIESTLHDPSGKRGVPIRFTIPSDARPTDLQAELPITWKLTLHAKLPGVDYKPDFDVPVYLTEDSQDGVEATDAPLTEHERVQGLEEALAGEKIAATVGANSLQLHCPPLRQPLSTLMVGGVGFALLGASIGMFFFLDEWVKWIFVPVFGAFGLVCSFLTLDFSLSCCDVRIDGPTWRVRSGWVGLRKERTFNADQVRKFSLKEMMSGSSGSGHKKWNNVLAHLVGGDKVTLTRGIANRQAERLLLEELRQRTDAEIESPGDDVPLP